LAVLVAVISSALPTAAPVGAAAAVDPVVGMAARPDGAGYWLTTTEGSVYAFGDAHFFGSGAAAGMAGPVVGIAATDDGRGYWLATAGGRVLAFGDAPAYPPATSGRVVAIEAAPGTRGYWLVTSSGRVVGVGGARTYGGTTPGPAVAIAPTADGHGYWSVTPAGQVSAFGDARRLGSLPAGQAGPVVGIGAGPHGRGYWLVTAGGGVFAFGTARSQFSADSVPAAAVGSVAGIVPTTGGRGYWLVGVNGSVDPFGHAAQEGSVPALPPAGPPRIAVYGDSLVAEATPALTMLAAADGAALRIHAFGGVAICDDLPVMAADAVSWQPTAVILVFSGDDFTRCMNGDVLGTPRYYAKYRADAAAAIAVFRPEGARVILVGAPVDRSPVLTRNVSALNRVFASAAAHQAGVEYLDAGASVERDGAFTHALPCLPRESCSGPGGTEVVRSPDGVHFCPTGRTHLVGIAEMCDVYSSGAFRFAGAMVTAALAPAVTAPGPPSQRRGSSRPPH
jgi:hypothetical protein